MIRPDAIISESARLVRDHGYTLREAMAVAELVEIFRDIGLLLVPADDVPTLAWTKTEV